MTRVIVFGGTGQLGNALKTLMPDSYELFSPSSRDVPLTDISAIATLLQELRPTHIINAAAYNKVDDAEGEHQLATAVNTTAPATMAEVAVDIGARFVHVSTDYVFDGFGRMPYKLDAPTNPLNAYGISKRDGEAAVLERNESAAVIRTAWVHSGGGANFVGTVVRVLLSGKPMTVVDDQVGTATRALNLARAVLETAAKPELRGVFHFTDAGVCSRYDVACAVLETLKAAGLASSVERITPISSASYQSAARRPNVSILDSHVMWSLLGWTPANWREGVVASTHEWIGALRHG